MADLAVLRARDRAPRKDHDLARGKSRSLGHFARHSGNDLLWRSSGPSTSTATTTVSPSPVSEMLVAAAIRTPWPAGPAPRARAVRRRSRPLDHPLASAEHEQPPFGSRDNRCRRCGASRRAGRGRFPQAPRSTPQRRARLGRGSPQGRLVPRPPARQRRGRGGRRRRCRARPRGRRSPGMCSLTPSVASPNP